MHVLINEFKFCYTKSTEDKAGLEKKQGEAGIQVFPKPCIDEEILWQENGK